MPKNIFTPRNELVCGKLDSAETIAVSLENIELIDLLHDIRFDCERMEQKLISRKEEAKVSIEEKKRVALLQKVVERLDAHLKALPGPIECGLSDNYKEFILETKLEA